MRKILYLALLILSLPLLSWAQAGNAVIIQFPGAPSGACSPIMVAVRSDTGAFYDCLTGSWNLVSSAGGGGTVTSVATTAPITGGTFTTSGTIACATCVTSSSPGAGIAHFAGSTQAVTSSAVALASDVSGQLPIGSVGSAGLSGTAPVTIAATGVIACATCATTTNGGALSGTSPVAISAAGAISINNNGITATQLAAQYAKKACGFSMGDGTNAVAAATYPSSGQMLQCVNNSGVTWTITGIHCFTDNAGTSTINVYNNAGTSLLTGAITCNATKTSGGAAGTQSATTTIATTDGLNFVFVADGTSKYVTATVDFTY